MEMCLCGHTRKQHLKVEGVIPTEPCEMCDQCASFSERPRDNDIKLTVSMERKINLGNYESATVFIGLSGVRADATAEEIDEALDGGRVVYDKIRERLKEQVQEARPW